MIVFKRGEKMKKILLILTILFSALVLAGCKEKDTVKILAPSGTPALSQMYVEEKKDNYNYKIDIVGGVDPLASAFTSASYDIIYAPINLGAKMYLNNGNYRLLGVVVYCNYYLVTKTDTDFTLDSLQGKDIVLFGENAVSGIMATYIFNENNLSNLNITYVNSVAEAQAELIKDPSKVILTAEPSLSVLESKLSGLKNISLSDEYETITGSVSFPQAGVFVKTTLDENVILRYEGHLKASVAKLYSDNTGSATLGSSLYTSFTKSVLEEAIPRSNINYKSALDAKNDCIAFFNLLNTYNPNLIGGEIDDDFYFEG